MKRFMIGFCLPEEELRDLADLGGKVLKLFFGEAETYHEALHGQNMKFRWFNGNRMNT
jgi:hypothetical protein